MWRNYFITSPIFLLLFQPGDELFPKDENGKLIFDSVDLCHTWEVTPRRRELAEKPGKGEPPSFLPPVRMGCGPWDSAVHESKGWDAGVVGRKPLLKCLHRGTKWKILDNEDNAFFLPCDMSSLFFYGGNGNSSTYVLTFFHFFLLILNASSWTWPCLLIFSAFILVLLPIPSDCSPPLPPRPWRSVRMQGWPSPLGCPTSTTSSCRRSWTSRGSSISPSATRRATQLLSLLLFRPSFLH